MRPKKKVKMSDIAREMNVSVVTVSKALSGQKGVSEETREQIQKIADDLGYRKSEKDEQPSISHTIGVLVAERYLKEDQSFYWSVYQQLTQRAMKKHCFSVLEVVSAAAEESLETPNIMIEKRVDGVIILGSFQREYADMLVSSSKVPMVSLDTSETSCADAVVSNNMPGGYLMTNYLFSLGHQKIGFVGTLRMTSSIDDRYIGYCKSLMKHGIDLKQAMVIEDRDKVTGMVFQKEGFKLPKEMPTAFFCNCDLSASVLIRQLREQGYRVPEDVSVVGFDNYVTDQFGETGITTYEINIKDMVARAVHVITHKIENAEYSNGVSMIQGRFIERESAARIAPPVPFA